MENMVLVLVRMTIVVFIMNSDVNLNMVFIDVDEIIK